jgi:epoxyqueuosine reductase
MTSLTSEALVARALEAGASLAGVARLDGSSVLVLALAHPVDEPELDWWGVKGGTEGNRRLMGISRRVVRWLRRERGVQARDLPYHVERGGVLLKDVAALAGLGAVGRNNLLVTGTLGSRVRLRALQVEHALAPTGPSTLDPCAGCDAPCRAACPRGALSDDGYSRARCAEQMAADEARPVEGLVRYCRACDLACPVGNHTG